MSGASFQESANCIAVLAWNYARAGTIANILLLFPIVVVALGSTSAVVSFDNSGALVNFVSDGRSRSLDGKTYEQLRWSIPVGDWREFGGRKLPGKAEALWTVPGGEFTYGRFELLEVQYNVTER